MEDFNISLTNHSNSSIYCKYHEPDTDLEKYAKRTSIILIVVFGIFGNIFAIVLSAKFTVRKNLHHLIINMAVSDALLLLTWLLHNIMLWTNEFGQAIIMHGSVSFLVNTAYRVSLVTLSVISIERFRATRRTLTRSRPYTCKQRVIVIGICWLIPMLIAAYWTSCQYVFLLRKTRKFLILADGISSVLLCFVILVLSIITMRRLSRPQAIQAHLNEQQRHLRNRRTKGAVRMVLVSVLLYMCCSGPALFQYTLSWLDVLVQTIEIFDFSSCIDWKSFNYILLTVLPLINSSFSPLIYIIFLPDFRQAAKKVLCRRETPNQAPNRRNSVHVLPEMHAISQNQ